VYDYLCLSLWLNSRPQDLISWHQKFFHQVMSIHHVNVHIDPPSVTTCLLCGSLSPTLRPCHVVEIAIPCWDKRSFVSFRLSRIKNHQPFPTDLHHHATVGSLSLKPTELTLVGQTCGHSSFHRPYNLWRTSSVRSTSLLFSFDPSHGTSSCRTSSMTSLSQSL
jgi:hypothetical protein